MSERDRLNKISETAIGAAIHVHRTLGPGLLESAYVACFAYDLAKGGLAVEQQKPVPLVDEEVKLECGYRHGFVGGTICGCRGQVRRCFSAHPRGSDTFISEAFRLQAGAAHQFQRHRTERRHQAVY